MQNHRLYLQSKGGFITEEESTRAVHLVEMIDAVQAEGEKVNSEAQYIV